MKNKSLFSILLLIAFILLPLISADLGPKPTVDIDVSYMGTMISDNAFNAKMLVCNQDERLNPSRDLIHQLNISEYDSNKSCYWEPAYFAWGGDCKDSKCNFGYFPPQKFKLAVYVPSLNKVFISNEISRNNFNSNYKLELNSDGSANIYETTPFLKKDKISSFIKTLIITLFLELVVALIFLSIAKIRKKLLLSVLLVNVISLPIVWFIFPFIGNIILVILLAEIFAFVFEAYFIYYLNKKDISLKKSFILSLLMNLASLIIGGFIFYFISSF